MAHATESKVTRRFLETVLIGGAFASAGGAWAAPKHVTAACIPLSNVCIPTGVIEALKVVGVAGDFPESALTPTFKPLDEGFCKVFTAPRDRPAGYKVVLPAQDDGSVDANSSEIQGILFSNDRASATFTDPDGTTANVTRQWSFNFKGRGSEMGLQLIDYRVNELVDKASGKVIEVANMTSNPAMQYDFFPRTNLPAIQSLESADGKQLQVTLPTGEKVSFDAATLKVKSGVLTETPTAKTLTESDKLIEVSKYSSSDDRIKKLKQILGTKASYQLKSKIHAADTEIQYTGKGAYIVEQVMNQDDSRGPGHKIQIKKGQPDSVCLSKAKNPSDIAQCSNCTVQSSLLWKKSSAGCYQSQFPTDQKFDDFLKLHCKFTLFKPDGAL